MLGFKMLHTLSGITFSRIRLLNNLLKTQCLRQVNTKQLFHSTSTLCDFRDSNGVEQMLEGLLSQRRSTLAEAITLIESVHPLKKKKAAELLTTILRYGKQNHDEKTTKSFRIGLTGPPGAGKSTLIECLGKFLTAKGHRVAVLAVDPSSSTTGGSLLGDKTRMHELSRDPNAFIRPSPASGHLGGVTRTTNESIVLCETAGFDVILVETVGVGQSEFKVADMVDMFCLIIPPAGGDELQGIKRGIVELSDLVIVNKADGDFKPAARRIQAEYSSALRLMRPRNKFWRPKVSRVSAVTKEGLDKLWDEIDDFKDVMLENKQFYIRRSKQRKVWMWNHINEHIVDVFKNHPQVTKIIHGLENDVISGEMMPANAADLLLQTFFTK